MKILVTYASRYGSTAEIAEKIGEVIASKGHETTVKEVSTVHDLKPYSAIILGSAVYVGRWRKDAVRFMKVNEKELKQKKVWIFSTGPTGTGDPVELLEGWKFPKSLQPLVENIEVEEITVFHGAVDMDKLSGLHRFMANKVNAPVGDFRIWEDIEKWAAKIADKI